MARARGIGTPIALARVRGGGRLAAMSRCAACGHENQPGAKFCSECATAMVEAADVREERKVVTVLFADLVGFTSRSEQLDPEDVRAFLSPYYARLRTELERYGGTVEKFIGDAVMALFGAPVAHEDDPERAVRAALAIRDWVLEQEVALQLRIAVNTGEALVSLGARPGQGEGMASGDVVNTSARLQSAAPVNGILVGETTYRATEQAIMYRAAAAVSAKGKAEPVPAWEAVEARSRAGTDLARRSTTPLIGRDNELRVLTDALARVRRVRSPQLVTLVGVPGIGKTRLVAELSTAVDADPELIFWRQGRSLPYGDGVTFWALAEMVKAQAGILETDSLETAEGKLADAVATLFPDPADAHWIEAHLRPLAGINSGIEAAGDRREEAFTAWRRFFEALGESGPLVLVFEDLHWADDNLLDFVEHLVDWAGGVPILVICSARPELFERRAGWAASMRNATRLSLAPLSDEETAQLISSLSFRPVMPADTQQLLLDRAGGNPLYAEQYVRMLAERSDTDELPLPETVQGIIAARLDALPGEEKRLLQNAAVLGKVFWLGALTEGAGIDRRTAEMRLHALERKDFVQRVRRSSVADEAEYNFLHSLVRDVAYGQIPRGERAEKHRLAAEWIGSLGRSEDHAEMRAHHYRNALELHRASGQKVDPGFAERALESLREAGDRAHALNAYATSASFYESASKLSKPGSPEHARLLFKVGRSRYLAGDVDPAFLTTASDEALAVGDHETAAEAETALAELNGYRGDRDAAMNHLNRARELAGDKPTSVRARVLASISRQMMLAMEGPEAIRYGQEAFEMAGQLGLDDVRADALISIGVARWTTDDTAGDQDLERSVRVAEEAHAYVALCRAKLNLASIWWQRGDLERSWVVLKEAEDVASRFGQAGRVRSIRADSSTDQFARGHWTEALTAIDAYLGEVEGGKPHYAAPWSYSARAMIRSARDDTPGALADVERALVLARLTKDPQSLYPTLVSAAHVFHETGHVDRAAELVDEVLVWLSSRSRVGSAIDSLPLLASTMVAMGRAEELLDLLPGRDSAWVLAAAAIAEGDFRQAADVCGAMGALTEEARIRLQLAESLLEQRRRADADVELQRAMAFYSSVGATRYLREGEALLAESA
jgi:class 3 adenylate cyclase